MSNSNDRRWDMAIEKVLVVGLGQMGRGILQVCAQAGLKAYGYDLSEESVQKAKSFIETGFDKRIAKGKSTAEEKQSALDNITVVSKLEEAKEVDLAIEAVFEDPCLLYTSD